MGIYTNFTSNDYYGDVPERNLFEECGETATYEEIALNLVAESENNYSMIMKAVALDELAYLEETGEEIIYESEGRFSSFLKKIKEFFIKLIEKVRQLLHNFVAKISSLIKNDHDFATKYDKEFADKWRNVKESFEFKGYKFTLNIPSKTRTDIAGAYGGDAIDRSGLETAEKDFIKRLVDKSSTTAAISDLIGKSGSPAVTSLGTNIAEKLRDNADDILEAARGVVAKDVSEVWSTKPMTDEPNMTASDFSKALFEMFRNGESAKENIEKKDIVPKEVVDNLKDSSKMKSSAEKACKAVTDGISDIVKIYDNVEKQLGKSLLGNDMKDATDSKASSGSISTALSIVSAVSDQLKSISGYYVEANGAYLQALNDRSRQCKAIMVKVIGGGKKVTGKNESYNYDDYNGYTNEGTSFLAAVNLK